MVASKYLYDDGEVDEVFNDDWAEAGRIDVKEMNKLEIEFLCAVEWSLHVQDKEFEQMTQVGKFNRALLQPFLNNTQLSRNISNFHLKFQNLETAVALKRLNTSPASSTPTTYADLDVLSRAIGLRKMLGVSSQVDFPRLRLDKLAF